VAPLQALGEGPRREHAELLLTPFFRSASPALLSLLFRRLSCFQPLPSLHLSVTCNQESGCPDRSAVHLSGGS